jgi:glyoxylase I family protein
MQPTRSPDMQPIADEALAIQLDHAAIMTTQLDAAVDFYTRLIGLHLRVIEEDPIRKGRRRALLTDANGREVLELIEMPELSHPTIPGRGGIHHLGFRVPATDWHALRARLDAAGYPYQEVHQRLFVRDADGLVLEIEPLR